MLEMRDGFGEGLLQAASADERVVALSADVCESTRMGAMARAFPDRYFEMGISEQNMMGVAAGMALEGAIPFTATYAVFGPGRSWEQLRDSVCYQNANVKVIGAHVGFGSGRDGATHQAFEDIAITRCLPNLTVLAPADFNQCNMATLAIAGHQGPVYMRMSRNPAEAVTEAGYPFEIGRMQTMRGGDDLTIIAIGGMVATALEISNWAMNAHGRSVRVLNCHTIKPIDRNAIVAATRETAGIVTLEEHQVHGGLGSAVAEVVVESGYPVPMRMIGMPDRFGASGRVEDLLAAYGLDQNSIRVRVSDFMAGLGLSRSAA
jgi:transketolase